MTRRDSVWGLPATAFLSLLSGTLLALSSLERGVLSAVLLGVVVALFVFAVMTLVRAGQRGP